MKEWKSGKKLDAEKADLWVDLMAVMKAEKMVVK